MFVIISLCGGIRFILLLVTLQPCAGYCSVCPYLALWRHPVHPSAGNAATLCWLKQCLSLPRFVAESGPSFCWSHCDPMLGTTVFVLTSLCGSVRSILLLVTLQPCCGCSSVCHYLALWHRLVHPSAGHVASLCLIQQCLSLPRFVAASGPSFCWSHCNPVLVIAVFVIISLCGGIRSILLLVTLQPCAGYCSVCPYLALWHRPIHHSAGYISACPYLTLWHRPFHHSAGYISACPYLTLWQRPVHPFAGLAATLCWLHQFLSLSLSVAASCSSFCWIHQCLSLPRFVAVSGPSFCWSHCNPVLVTSVFVIISLCGSVQSILLLVTLQPCAGCSSICHYLTLWQRPVHPSAGYSSVCYYLALWQHHTSTSVESCDIAW